MEILPIEIKGKKQNEKLFSFGICECCGTNFGLMIERINKIPIFHYLCFGDQQIDPCPYYNRQLDCDEVKYCRLKNIDNFDSLIKFQSKFILDKIKNDLKNGEIGLIIYPNKVISKIYDDLKKNERIMLINSVMLDKNTLFAIFKLF